MPTTRRVTARDRGSFAEQLAGVGDEKRSTKTYIEDGTLAMFLGLVQGLPESWITMGRRIYAEENDVNIDQVTSEFILKKFPEARELLELHQRIIEHKGSVGGYLVDRITSGSVEDLHAVDEERPASAALGRSFSKRWS